MAAYEALTAAYRDKAKITDNTFDAGLGNLFDEIAIFAEGDVEQASATAHELEFLASVLLLAAQKVTGDDGATSGGQNGKTGMSETMNHDDYGLDDDNFDGDDGQINTLKERLNAYRHAAAAVVATWSQGDLATAVRRLQALLDGTIPLPPGFWEEKAERLGFALTQCASGNYWMMDGDDEPTRYDAAKEAVESLG